LLGAVLLIGVVLLSVLLAFLPSTPTLDESGTVRSPRPLGRRGLYLLLQESGFDARAFVDAPRDLPRDRSLLWLPCAPTSKMPAQGRGILRGGMPERVGLHRLAHYKTFVESGGTILLAAGEDTQRFLVDTLGLAEAEELELEKDTGDGAVEVLTGGGEVLALSGGVTGAFRQLDQNSPARALWTVEHDGAAHPFAVEFPTGLGAVVVLANDAFTENRNIGDADHALAAVRLVEELAPGGTCLFSEYEAGHWDPPSTLALLFGPKLVLVTLHGLVLLGLFVWMQGFARAFSRDPEPLALFSPYLRARSLADVLARGRRTRTLGAMLRAGALERYRRIARQRTNRAAEREEGGPALARVREADVTEFARAAGVADLEGRLTELLVQRADQDDAGLDALDARLRAMERELETRMRARAASGIRSGDL
jgi:hypothetical protein